MPLWTPEELDDMGYKLRQGIERSMLLRLVVLRRIRYLEVMSNYDKNHLRPKWVEEEYKKWRRDMLQKKKSKKPVPTLESQV